MIELNGDNGRASLTVNGAVNWSLSFRGTGHEPPALLTLAKSGMSFWSWEVGERASEEESVLSGAPLRSGGFIGFARKDEGTPPLGIPFCTSRRALGLPEDEEAGQTAC